MDAGTAVTCVSAIVLSCGAAVIAVGFAGMHSYRVRRRLYRYRPPIDNPITLQSVGCWVWFAGFGAMVLGLYLSG